MERRVVLRQLARLTRPVDAAGERALAIAVYADEEGRSFPAAEAGAEGVACVDDAARAFVLLCDLWQACRLPYLREWAAGLLRFVLYMQEPDGRFVNFISDRSGLRNRDGRTSLAGGGFWQARALRALVAGDVVLGEPRARAALERAIVHARAADVPSDVRSIDVHAALALLRAGRMSELRGDVERWCDEIAARRVGDVLMDNPDQSAPHLWGHMQEGVLADAGAYLRRPDLVDVARRSARAFLAPLIASAFAGETSQPYGVACAAHSMDRLAIATGDGSFDELATLARAWFDGRNAASRAVYDRAAGRVHDGIDADRVNAHSGAESNIVGAQALLAEATRLASSSAAAIAESFSPAARRHLRLGEHGQATEARPVRYVTVKADGAPRRLPGTSGAYTERRERGADTAA